jgi:hypothetical protein
MLAFFAVFSLPKVGHDLLISGVLHTPVCRTCVYMPVYGTYQNVGDCVSMCIVCPVSN